MVNPSRRGRIRALSDTETTIVVDDGSGNFSWDNGAFADADALDKWKQPCRVASTASVTVSTALNSGDTIDGVTLATGDRVLLKDQGTGSQNGIYIVGTTPERAPDMDDDAEVMGSIVYVIAGTANGGKAYKNTNTSVPTVGSTSLTFAEFGAGSTSFGTPANTYGTPAAGAASTAIRTDAVLPGPPILILTLTNKSGGSVAAGDVVVIDTSNDTAFTTTTTGQAEVSVGVAQATIANNASGAVLVAGYAALVNVPSSMTRGRYVETHTVAKQATGSATRRAGSFGQFLIAGTTPTAWLWGKTDQTSSGGGSGDTSGEIGAGFDGGLSLLVAGKTQDVIAPFTGTITGWTILADTTGSAAFGVSKSAYSGFPGSLTSITAAAPPTLTAAQKATSSTLTGWTTSVTAGDVVRFTLSSVSGLRSLVIALAYSRP